MGYTIIIDEEKIEVHSDMCDRVFEKKEEISFKNLEFIDFNKFEEFEELIKDKENVVFCEECNPQSKAYDEEWDDFYQEFDDEDEIDDTRCEI